ncbi:MAG: nickel-responsive transcriptional regulator NikR [Deltaproteobacteria bacterium]|nr:nickel-responsive transcriptional regulator NikR [Deltaproteobacteria bacterium]
MSHLLRFGISIDSRLLKQFDDLIAEKGYVNRSEAIRDLIRDTLVTEASASAEEEIVGTVTLVYDHHTRELARQLNDRQHASHGSVISALHVHLDEHNCLEVIVVKGKAGDVKKLADEMIGARGVKHGKLVMTTTGKNI